MENLNSIEKAKRNKSNYLKAKDAFNKNNIDECILFYAPNHEVKAKQSEKGREGIQKFFEGMHLLPHRVFFPAEFSIINILRRCLGRQYLLSK